MRCLERTTRVAAIPLCLVAATWATPVVGQDACVAPDALIRLDHVPIAAADPGAVTARLVSELGLSIKPGRAHENGLENVHIKFRDGSALELMTVGEPRDALARQYARMIADGGGGAFLALSGLPIDSILAIVGPIEPDLIKTETPAFDWASFPEGHLLNPVFFVDVHQRPPDLPEHLNHASGVTALQGVWVVVEEPERLVRLLTRLGGVDCGMRGHAEHLYGRAVGLGSGTVYVVDAGLWEADPDSAPVASLTLTGPMASPRTIILGEAGGLWLEVRPIEGGR